MLDLDYQHSAELANLIMRSINVKICTKDLACQTVLEGKFGFNQSYIGIELKLSLFSNEIAISGNLQL